MPLRKCMEEHTERDLELWTDWMNEEECLLTPLHYYLAQIALEVIRGRVRHPGSVKLEHCLFKFVPPAPPLPPEIQKQHDLVLGKAHWLGQMSKNVQVKTISKEEAQENLRKVGWLSSPAPEPAA